MNGKTPSVTVLDNRGLIMGNIAYYQHPDSPDVIQERITRSQFNVRGFLTQSADPRLYDAGLVNVTGMMTLAGDPLRTQSVDAGISVTLNDALGRPFIAVSNIRSAQDGTEDRGQAVTRTCVYEDHTGAGRLLAIAESASGGVARTTDRFVYAGNSDAEKGLNLAGQCVSHYDTAGLVQTDSIDLTGIPMSVTRRLMRHADDPDTLADWQGEETSAWDDLLDDEVYITLTTADAVGAVLTTTDARGNQQRVAYDMAGLLSGSWLTLNGGTEQLIVKSLTYSAAGHKLREEHGNGVVTTYTYEAETQRLTGMTTERPVGHASGAKVLQDLRYEYDPVGNVLSISNDAEETRFWRNQKVVPENRFTYDSLYQLISATGREIANIGQQSSSLPSAIIPLPADNSVYTNYIRTYTYDTGGNLTRIRHSASASGNNYTTDITVSDCSNRAVLSSLSQNPSDVDMLFTAGGQQKQLQPGQMLSWTPRNELRSVTPVERDGGADDRESYRYDSGSQRILKVSVQKTGGSSQTQRVVYLPGLELRNTAAEHLQVLTPDIAGHARVRVLHWESGRPEGISNDRLRYSYVNLTGSNTLELDETGSIISMEEFYPYGGTAILSARSAVEVSYKTVRYSGKERDATGLYYYGYRYYQPWVGRWLSADPAGTVDGLNLYRMVQNNPVNGTDKNGLFTSKIRQLIQDHKEKKAVNRANASYTFMQRGALWGGRITDKASFDRISQENLAQLKAKNYPLTKDAHDFVERFNQLDLNLVHFTNADLIKKGKATFYSRYELFKRKIAFATENTEPADIGMLNTTDFAFFSLSVADVGGKSRSRFGNKRYETRLSDVSNNKYVRHSHVAINDTLSFARRAMLESELQEYFSYSDAKALYQEKIADNASQTVFSLDDFREGLALRMVNTARGLSAAGESNILNIQGGENIDGLISLLFRPQFLVPKKLESEHTRRV